MQILKKDLKIFWSFVAVAAAAKIKKDLSSKKSLNKIKRKFVLNCCTPLINSEGA